MNQIMLILYCLSSTACYSLDSDHVSKLGIVLATEKCSNLGGLRGMTEATYNIRKNQELRVVLISANCGNAVVSFSFRINPNGAFIATQ